MSVEYVKRLRPDMPTCAVTLANGTDVPANIYTGAKGMPVCHLVGKGQMILPLTWLIDRFCKLDADWTKLVSPTGTEFDISYTDRLPYIKKEEVDKLMAYLPHEDQEGRSGKLLQLGLR